VKNLDPVTLLVTPYSGVSVGLGKPVRELGLGLAKLDRDLGRTRVRES
jgi:hypothetical protein